MRRMTGAPLVVDLLVDLLVGLLVGLLVVTAIGCQPEILSNTYFCGVERFCPPNLVCNDTTFSCVESFEVQSFSCPDGSEAGEPNNSTDTATMLGDLECGAQLLSGSSGCVVGDDVDFLQFTGGPQCNGNNPHVLIKLRFPIATAPLVLEAVDDAGRVVGTGEDCTPADNFSGRQHLCLELAPPSGVVYLRIQLAPDGADCDGACRHNQYLLDIAFPLS